MFIGHFALGLAAKKIDSKPSIGTTMLAAQFVDLLWPFFLIFGIETVSIDPGNTAFTPLDFTHYPYSHSLTAVLIWAILFGGIYYLITKNKKGSLLLGALVISHWVLDFITHRPDLPLSFSENEMVGLGLWNNKALTIIIEGGIFVICTWIYLRSTKAINKKGIVLIWTLLILLVASYITNLAGPPPPNVDAIGYAGLLQWIFIGLGYWADKNRQSI